MNRKDKEKADSKQIYKLILSKYAAYIVLLAVILNIKYLNWNITKETDRVQNTNYSQNSDLSQIPKVSNKLYLISAIIIVIILYDTYKNVLNWYNKGEASLNEVNTAEGNLQAIMLVLVATTISYYVLNSEE